MNDAVQSLFRSVFGGGPAPVVRSAPGRVNLIGAHVDYNLGPVMPIALDRGTWVAVRPRAGRGRRARLVSRELGAGGVHDLDALRRGAVDGWAAYPLGAVAVLAERGVEVGGFDLAVAADLDVGAGLSSSASLLVAVLRGLDATFGLGLAPAVHAELAFAAETGFVGVSCGVMDPMASALARPGHALRLDCRDRSIAHVPLDERLGVVLIDSGTRRSLTDSSFNRRVTECRAAVDAIRRRRPEVESLRDATLEDVAAAEVDDVVRRRARHVVEEIDRVARFEAALRAGDLAECGRLVSACHASLRDAYEASTAALDFLVARACAVDGVVGARLTGAGWGGNVLVLCARGVEARVAAAVGPAYRDAFGRDAAFRPVRVDGGPRDVSRRVAGPSP